MEICCLSVKGGSINNDVLDLLLLSAQQIMWTKKHMSKINDSSLDVRGSVKTKYKLASLGTTTGIVFTAEFSMNGNDVTAVYIVKPVNEKLYYDLFPHGTWRKENENYMKDDTHPWRN